MASTIRNPQMFVECSMERSLRYDFLLIWRPFYINSHLIIVRISISWAVFPILIVHHSLRTNPYKMSIFQRSVTCSFFFKNCSHILTRTWWKKFEDMFLVKIASKGTSFKQIYHIYIVERVCFPCVNIYNPPAHIRKCTLFKIWSLLVRRF